MKKKRTPVIAHQILAAAKIIVEQLTSLGYDDEFAAIEYVRLKKYGMEDQAAIRFIAQVVETYDMGSSTYDKGSNAKTKNRA